MPSRLSIILCAVVGLAWTQPAAAAETTTETVELHAVESQILEQTNNARARRGLPRLILDRRLLHSARRHCAWMTTRRTLQHGRDGVAENIAMGQHSAQEVVQDWLNSPGHRANMLNPGHTRIGIAAYTASNGAVYWCQQFTR